jgi:hypothetical protein
MRVRRTLIATTAVVAGVSMFIPSPAGAHTRWPTRPPSYTVLTSSADIPFNLAVRPDGTVLMVSGGGGGRIDQVNPDGTTTGLRGRIRALRGIALSADGRYLAYTDSATGPRPPVRSSGLSIWGPDDSLIRADIKALEQDTNPDAAIHYGVTNPSQCVREQLSKVGFPVGYTGPVDSHPHSVAAYGEDFVVADAGSNTVVRVTRDGTVSTIAVLPPHVARITAAAASTLGMGTCVVGVRYAFEAVPTDVEVGRDGYLYVTTLPTASPSRPGAPGRESSRSALGKVFRVNPTTGKVKELASGLRGPTNLALANQKIYIAENYAGRISVLEHGKVRTFLTLPGALAVETGPAGSLYASTGLTDTPSVVKINTHRGWRR